MPKDSESFYKPKINRVQKNSVQRTRYVTLYGTVQSISTSIASQRYSGDIKR